MANSPQKSGQGQSQIQEQGNIQAQKIVLETNHLLELDPERFEEVVASVVDRNDAIEKKIEDEKFTASESTSGKYYEPARYSVSQRTIDYFDNTACNTESLVEHMEEQVRESNLTPLQQTIAKQIIGNLNRAGYLTRLPYEIADDVTFNSTSFIDVGEEEVLEVLDFIQHNMEPAGIAARDSQECLLLQLGRRHNALTPLATTIVNDYFGDLLNNRLDRIATALNIDVDKVVEAKEKEIKKLDPSPGSAFSSDGILGINGIYITPTFIIDIDEDDNIGYEIPCRIPELYVSKSYKDYLEETKKRKDMSENEQAIKDNINKKVDDAGIFVSALEMRMKTLKSVIEAIIHLQRDYFLSYGDETQLKPMKLQDLSNITGRDAAVMSRATSGKYMETPWGLVPLRTLFSGVIKKEDDDVSTREIKAALKELVANEDKKFPLSDQAITNMLNEKGYQVARRTVAKYREQLDIPVATQRKQYN
ncbi:MAG: RNA polymerase factor sigma-54 [Muribaculaceae bacterium]|nr:RNA polymerase factor sigma-54 [Muribaculaceae bacterium]